MRVSGVDPVVGDDHAAAPQQEDRVAYRGCPAKSSLRTDRNKLACIGILRRADVQIEHQYRDRPGDGINDPRTPREVDRMEIGEATAEGLHRGIEARMLRMRLGFPEQVGEIGKRSRHEIRAVAAAPGCVHRERAIPSLSPMWICSIEPLTSPELTNRFQRFHPAASGFAQRGLVGNMRNLFLGPLSHGARPVF